MFARDETGHAEVVEVDFDPTQVSYDQLLDVFWSNHNPTTMNRQGPDMGRNIDPSFFIIRPNRKLRRKNRSKNGKKWPI